MQLDHYNGIAKQPKVALRMIGNNGESPAYLYLAHPIDGQITIRARADHAILKCHWPFDMETDEWIDITDSYDRQAFETGIARLFSEDYIQIPGLSGELVVKSKDADNFLLDIRTPSTSFYLAVPRSAFNLQGMAGAC